MTTSSTSVQQPRSGGGGGRSIRPSISSFNFGGFFSLYGLVLLILAGLVIYGGYYWLKRRVVVHRGQVLVLIRKDAGRSLPGDQVIIPRPPDKKDQAAYAAWEK